MEFLFVFTHSVMLICLIGITSISVSDCIGDDKLKAPGIVSSLMAKIRSIQINVGYLSRTVTALFALFLS